MVDRTSSVRVRLALEVDAPAITTVLRSVGDFHHLAAELPTQTQMRVATQLARALAATLQGTAEHTIFVAERLGDERVIPPSDVIGYCAIHWMPNLLLGAEGYVSELFVRADMRGLGAGALLLDAARTEAQKRQCVRLQLVNLRTRESYQRGFYHKQQWVERPDAAVFTLSLPE